MAREAIFIGYRREDTADVAGRIYDALATRFGRDSIFKDVDNIRPGADFGEYIKTILPRCRVVLVLIGPNWIDASDESGRRRLDDPHDWVRVEIETALSAGDLDVVPVLVNGAHMPRAQELPESLRPLLRRNAATIRRDPDFHGDVERLGNALRASVRTGILDLANLGSERKRPGVRAPRSRLPAWAFIVAAAVAVLAAVVWAPWRNPNVFDDCSGASWCPRMVIVPAGTFTMGSPDSELGRKSDEGPQHAVSISQFAVGEFEVTFDQWAACVGRGGCASNPNPNDEGFGRGNHPVINVSWNDAQQYVRWLNQATGLDYRLLTEAEWEYVARAGTSTAYSTGLSITPSQARFQARSTASVGSFPANRFGLYDTNGNVEEWVLDCHHDDYTGAPTNGGVWITEDCFNHVLRGGDWTSAPQDLRSANRDYNLDPSDRGETMGFRVARSL